MGIFLKHYRDGVITQDGHPASSVDWIHRDNHYLFLFQENASRQPHADTAHRIAMDRRHRRIVPQAYLRGIQQKADGDCTAIQVSDRIASETRKKAIPICGDVSPLSLLSENKNTINMVLVTGTERHTFVLSILFVP
ncbi:MAG: hypothetical protein LBS09_06105 [Bacteroidales bacterium]|jgi:hypothetical protein|nr:hypothetical protein [Bacteroidales bacterium]